MSPIVSRAYVVKRTPPLWFLQDFLSCMLFSVVILHCIKIIEFIRWFHPKWRHWSSSPVRDWMHLICKRTGDEVKASQSELLRHVKQLEVLGDELLSQRNESSGASALTASGSSFRHQPITDQISLDCEWLPCGDGNTRQCSSEEQERRRSSRELVWLSLDAEVAL